MTHDEKQAAVQSALASLPPAAYNFVQRWRAAVELWGRCQQHGDQLDALDALITDVDSLTKPKPETGKVAGYQDSGGGY